MIARIFWSIVLISTLYVLGVFFLPSQIDEIAATLGISPVNSAIRNTATFFQTDIGNMVVKPLEEGSGYVRQAQDIVDKTKASLDATREVVGQKAEQVQKVVDSVGKTTDAIGELKQNVSNLATISSGSASSGTTTSSGNITAS